VGGGKVGVCAQQLSHFPWGRENGGKVAVSVAVALFVYPCWPTAIDIAPLHSVSCNCNA